VIIKEKITLLIFVYVFAHWDQSLRHFWVCWPDFCFCNKISLLVSFLTNWITTWWRTCLIQNHVQSENHSQPVTWLIKHFSWGVFHYQYFNKRRSLCKICLTKKQNRPDKKQCQKFKGQKDTTKPKLKYFLSQMKEMYHKI